MKKSMLVLMGMLVGFQAFAQEKPCRAKVNAYIDQWDDRTVMAVARGLDQVKTEYVKVSFGITRGATNTLFAIELKETNYSWTKEAGHQIELKAIAYVIGQRDQGIEFSDVAQSYESRELAITALITKMVNQADFDSMAKKAGCPKI